MKKVFKICPTCGKKGLYEIAMTAHNILMSKIRFRCRYCEFKETDAEKQKRNLIEKEKNK